MDRRNNNGLVHNTVYRRSPKRNNNRLKIVIYFVIVLILALSAFFISNAILKRRNQTQSETDNTSDVIPEETTISPEEEKNPSEYSCKVIEVASADIHKGNLILVNSDFPYVFPTEENLKNIYENRPAGRPYKLSTINLQLNEETLNAFNKMLSDFANSTGNHYIQITSAYRSFDDQQTLYDNRVASVGAVEAAKYVALAGNSEHHIGSAVDINIYDDNGISYTLDKYDDTIDWIYQNCHKYGFILRYPTEKISVTGISYEPWHFRYIGAPHAYMIYSENYCFEEYTAELRNHPFNGEHLKIEDDAGVEYDVYYVPASNTETTEVKVPETLPYTISGNNVDGFIVTVTLTK